MKNLKFILIAFFSIFLVGCTMGGSGQGSTGEVEGISFNTDGGEEIEAITGLTVGEQLRLPTPTKEGHNFLGWFADEECSGTMLPTRYTYNGPVTLYAKWFVGTYKIFFKSEVSVDLETIQLKYGEPINLEDPVNASYDFVGWFLDGEEFNLETMPGKDITLEARWEAKKLNVTVDLNGGTASNDFEEVISDFKAGSTLDLEKPVKDGYIFIGWFDGEDARAKQYTSKTPIYHSTSLIARYKPISEFEESYELKLDLNGGSLSSAVTSYNTGEGLILPVPTKAGYEFLGWYFSLECVGDTWNSISKNQTGNLTLFAGWKENKDVYTVTFVYPNKEETVEVESGKPVAEKDLSTSTLELTWYNGREVYDFTQSVYEDLTLVANYKDLEDVIESIIPEVAYENINLVTQAQVGDETIYISWTSSDINTISNTGITNPARQDSVITMNAQFKYQGQVIKHSFDVLVPQIVFQDLSEIKPVFGYVYATSHRGFTDTAIETLDVVNVAFGRVTSDSTVSVDSIPNLSSLLQIRKTGTRVVLSLGGYGSGGIEFSNTAASSEKRKIFAESILEVIETYHLDGIDIDWEYPGSSTAGIPSHHTDTANLNLFCQELYGKIKAYRQDALLTMAVGPYNSFDFAKLHPYIDYFNLMTYDHSIGDSTAMHHSSLYTGTYAHTGVHGSVNFLLNKGVPAKKIVIGCAFYGRTAPFASKQEAKLGGKLTTTLTKTYSYTQIEEGIKNGTYIEMYDEVACANYIITTGSNTAGRFITYDGVQSVTAKCNYVIEHELGGVMFWDYTQDKNGTLVNAINEAFKEK